MTDIGVRPISPEHPDELTWGIYLPAQRLVGQVHFRWLADQWHLMNIEISSEHRQQGLSKVLLRHALNELSDHEHSRHAGSECELTLEVRASNSVAIELYRGLAMRDVGRRPRYYSAPADDAVLMTGTIADALVALEAKAGAA